MSADGGAATHSQKQTQLIFTAEADSLRLRCAFPSTQPAHGFFSLSLPFFFFFLPMLRLQTLFCELMVCKTRREAVRGRWA